MDSKDTFEVESTEPTKQFFDMQEGIQEEYKASSWVTK